MRARSTEGVRAAPAPRSDPDRDSRVSLSSTCDASLRRNAKRSAQRGLDSTARRWRDAPRPRPSGELAIASDAHGAGVAAALDTQTRTHLTVLGARIAARDRAGLADGDRQTRRHSRRLGRRARRCGRASARPRLGASPAGRRRAVATSPQDPASHFGRRLGVAGAGQRDAEVTVPDLTGAQALLGTPRCCAPALPASSSRSDRRRAVPSRQGIQPHRTSVDPCATYGPGGTTPESRASPQPHRRAMNELKAEPSPRVANSRSTSAGGAAAWRIRRRDQDGDKDGEPRAARVPRHG